MSERNYKIEYIAGYVAEMGTDISKSDHGWYMRVRGDDGRDYYVGGLFDYIDLEKRLRPPVSGRQLDEMGYRWLGRKVHVKYTEFRGKLLILNFILEKERRFEVNYIRGRVAEISTTTSWIMRVRGDDGRDYFVENPSKYTEIEQSLKPPYFEQRPDELKEKWSGKRIDIRYVEFQDRLLILDIYGYVALNP